MVKWVACFILRWVLLSKLALYKIFAAFTGLDEPVLDEDIVPIFVELATDTEEVICGGVLISTHEVLIAAHCMWVDLI